jgi:hypothetical protein
MSETRVWIAQCLCGPNRHAILAVAGEAASEAAASDALLPQLRDAVASMVPGILNPWCGICGAEAKGWRYEVGRTPFRTLEEAGPELARLAAGNLAANALYGTHGPTRPGR